MAEKNQTNSRGIAIIVIAVVVVLAVAFGIFKIAQNNNKAWEDASKADDIVISDKDSKEVKIEKIEKKIELINEEIEKVQAKIEPEAEKLNKLYEDYVGVMNEYQTGTPTTSENNT